MISRTKTQDPTLKSKSVVQSEGLRNRDGTNSNSLRQEQETAVAEISMKEFLDFLKISYQVNEAVDNSSSDVPEKALVDWRKLTSDSLISRLKEREALLNKEKTVKVKNEVPVGSQDNPQENKKIRSENQSSSEDSSENPTSQNSEEKTAEKKSSFERLVNPLASLERRPSTLSLDRKVVLDRVKRSGLGRKKSHPHKKDNNVEKETCRSLDGVEENRSPGKLLKKKLNDILQEGILDSVLPYLLPKQVQSQDNSQPAIKKLLNSNDVKRSVCGKSEKNEKLHGGSVQDKMEVRRKSISKNDILNSHDKKDMEVVIHVCDEIKNLKRDFRCSQKLLISHMGYFAEVTTGQKLEDMDISVHCDVTIFDWLMRWVQKDNYSQEHWPTLDPSIVIPVLMSSAFLQMNSLQEHCLLYCKSHINEIIRESPNLSCINDNVLTKLASLFSNTEVEKIVDKKDKIQSKLFCKLITALLEPEPLPERGHYSSIATIFRCSKCLKLILKNMSRFIHCVPSNMTMDRNGLIHSTHAYDFSWNLTEYVRNLKGELKTWRKVYWRLWSDCHLLYCNACEEYFPLHQMSWCRFHLECVQYFPFENQRAITLPIGRYSCCGERAYRFETIKKITGCQYRDHVINPKTTAEVEMLRLWNFHKDVIHEEPPPFPSPERIKYVKSSKEEWSGKKSPVKEGFWWEGLELVPSKRPAGLLTKIWDTVIRKDDAKIAGNNAENKVQKPVMSKTLTNTQSTSLQETSSLSDISDDSCSSSNDVCSEESYHSGTKCMTRTRSSSVYSRVACARLALMRREKKKKRRKKRKIVNVKNEGSRFWLSKLSTRSNQDNQREFEERALRQIETVLAKKLSGESFRTGGSRSNYQVIPAGGIYVKLEQEWREAHCFSHGCPGSSIKARGSNSYVNMNSSSLSMHKRSKSKGHR